MLHSQDRVGVTALPQPRLTYMPGPALNRSKAHLEPFNNKNRFKMTIPLKLHCLAIGFKLMLHFNLIVYSITKNVRN